VTVTGNTIRMRGLDAGYTQILVNGERPPPGFSLDNLPPDQIEKIEIVRAARRALHCVMSDHWREVSTSIGLPLAGIAPLPGGAIVVLVSVSSRVDAPARHLRRVWRKCEAAAPSESRALAP